MTFRRLYRAVLETGIVKFLFFFFSFLFPLATLVFAVVNKFYQKNFHASCDLAVTFVVVHISKNYDDIGHCHNLSVCLPVYIVI